MLAIDEDDNQINIGKDQSWGDFKFLKENSVIVIDTGI